MSTLNWLDYEDDDDPGPRLASVAGVLLEAVPTPPPAEAPDEEADNEDEPA